MFKADRDKKYSHQLLHIGEKVQRNILNKNITTFVEVELLSTELHYFIGSQVLWKCLINYWQRRA